jgi:hypothetical protein
VVEEKVRAIVRNPPVVILEKKKTRVEIIRVERNLHPVVEIPDVKFFKAKKKAGIADLFF